MTKRTVFATLAIPATAAGLLAQDNVIITRGTKAADEAIMMAQTTAGVFGYATEPGNFRFMTQEFTFNGRVVTNAPYSAEEKTESVQTLADQTHITNTTTSRVYRDSQGRTRREVSLPGPPGETQPHTMITITDPVAGVNYTLDAETKTAHQMPGAIMGAAVAASKMRTDELGAKLRAEAEATRSHVETRTAGPVAAGSTGTATFEYHVARTHTPAPNSRHEELGGNMIEGVSVTGTRETSTIDTGIMGNDKPITITSERWYSPELEVEVKSVRNDPRMGQTSHTLTNISRAEPDSSLFRVPADYKLDEPRPGMQIRKFDTRSDR